MARLFLANSFEQTTSELDQLVSKHLLALRVRGYSEYTIRNRFVHIRLFLRWCGTHAIRRVSQISPELLKRYQEHLSEYRNRRGQPISIVSQYARLVPLRVWFRWMQGEKFIRRNPARDLQLPRLGRQLPRNILSAGEIERIMLQPNIKSPLGLRDRAILELLYSTGIRRLELLHLRVADIHLGRLLVFVR
jgi:integrase/recombinase XerD